MADSVDVNQIVLCFMDLIIYDHLVRDRKKNLVLGV